MLNTDLFKFELVDRMHERAIVDQYLSKPHQGVEHILWISGLRGTGKSYFLTEHVLSKKNYVGIYVDPSIDSAAPNTYLSLLIREINKKAKLGFAEYIRANYKSLAAIGQKVVNVALNLADLDDTGLDELGSSLTNYFISNSGERDNSLTVIKKYINYALHKCSNLVFVLDNFSQCDTASLEILISVIHTFQNEPHVRFIICTTDEDLADRFDILSALAEKIANKRLIIDPFNEKTIFVRMLERNIELTQEDIKLLFRVFELCDGFPQKFKVFLINLYAKQGILTTDNKATFSSDILNKLVIQNSITFDVENLCKEYKGMRQILQIVTSWGAPIQPTVLYDFIKFFAEDDPSLIVVDYAANLIQTLENLHIIKRTYDDGISLIQYKHDSITISMKEYFSEDDFMQYLHFTVYEYLMQLQDKTSPYWKHYYNYLFALHTYLAQVDGWIDVNFQYGLSFFERHQYDDARNTFERLETVIATLPNYQTLIIGATLFNCGYYQKAGNLMDRLCKNSVGLSTEQRINAYIYLARAKSCILDPTGAMDAINEAEKIRTNDHGLRTRLLGAKQSILFMSPDGFSEAKKIFDELVQDTDSPVDTPEMAVIYQSAMDYYEGAKSQQLLGYGLKLADKYSAPITKAKILNNIGFEHLRCNELACAERAFTESIGILCDAQPHEQVYPLSNLAVLSMINGDWEKALDRIAEALFWNKSEYASLVLKTNRMLCYYFTDKQQWKELYDELYNYISDGHTVDDKIYKKIGINLALILWKRGEYKAGAEILERCASHLSLEWEQGKYRFSRLYGYLTGSYHDSPIPEDTKTLQYYCGIEFEPWLINFSHD